MGSPEAEVLLADSVGKRFGDRRILTSATLRARAGEVRVLFGRNGVGKSTLLRIAAGLVPADTGTVHYRGRPRLHPTLASFARDGLFWLPDHDLLSHAFTLRTQLEFFRARFAGTAVQIAAQRCGVAALIDQRPSALSGGELRRAELAAGFVRSPRCLLADEPLRGVSPADAEGIGQLFRALAAEGCAVIVSGHEVALLNQMADQVTWCTAGTTYELGTPDQAASHDRFRMEYLGPSG